MVANYTLRLVWKNKNSLWHNETLKCFCWTSRKDELTTVNTERAYVWGWTQTEPNKAFCFSETAFSPQTLIPLTLWRNLTQVQTQAWSSPQSDRSRCLFLILLSSVNSHYVPRRLFLDLRAWSCLRDGLKGCLLNLSMISLIRDRLLRPMIKSHLVAPIS